MVKKLNSTLEYEFLKGSPEKIFSFVEDSNSDSKSVSNYQKMADIYVSRGFRVIALAQNTKNIGEITKSMNGQKLNLNEVEVKILGLCVFENNLKETTKSTIADLKNANIDLFMATGDNLNTAISVARNIDLVNEKKFSKIEDIRCFDREKTDPLVCYGITGDQFAILLEKYDLLNLDNFSTLDKNSLKIYDQLKYCLTKIKIFARFKPFQKEQLVKLLMSPIYGENNFVGMCGDGANDVSALKSSHVGVSLSKMEASIAAPFSTTGDSANDEISCVLDVIREGRAALASTISTFKFMALYGMIQLISVLILYTFNLNFSDFQYLFIDLAIIILLVFAMSKALPCQKISKVRPECYLFSKKVVISVVLQILLVGAFQAAVILTCQFKMKCWNLGYMGRGFEGCSCTFITDRKQIIQDNGNSISPKLVLAGTYNFTHVANYWRARYETEQIVCENDGDCSVHYANELYSNYTEVLSVLPEISPDSLTTPKTTQEWIDTCTFPDVEDWDSKIISWHHSIFQSLAVHILFYFTILQYILVGLLFSIGKPFRQNIYENKTMIAVFIFQVGSVLYFLFSEDVWVQNLFGTIVVLEKGLFYGSLFGFIGANLIFSWVVEFFVQKVDFSGQKRRRSVGYQTSINGAYA